MSKFVLSSPWGSACVAIVLLDQLNIQDAGILVDLTNIVYTIHTNEASNETKICIWICDGENTSKAQQCRHPTNSPQNHTWSTRSHLRKCSRERWMGAKFLRLLHIAEGRTCRALQWGARDSECFRKKHNLMTMGDDRRAMLYCLIV